MEVWGCLGCPSSLFSVMGGKLLERRPWKWETFPKLPAWLQVEPCYRREMNWKRRVILAYAFTANEGREPCIQSITFAFQFPLKEQINIIEQQINLERLFSEISGLMFSEMWAASFVVVSYRSCRMNVSDTFVKQKSTDNLPPAVTIALCLLTLSRHEASVTDKKKREKKYQ